jgi:glycosyltransferase involved in cell wall biosynthesis
MIDVSVVIPAYNEGKRIEKRIEDISNFLNNSQNIENYEIIIVDDGSEDNTKELLSKITDSHLKKIFIKENKGKGNALIEGARIAKFEYISFFDADHDLPICNLSRLINEIQNKENDCIICSKAHTESTVENPNRGFLSKGYYLFSKTLLGLPVSDSQVGAKIFRKKALEQIIPKLCVKRFAFDAELLTAVHAKECNIKEIPVTYVMDKTKKSTVSPSAMGNMFVDTCGIAYRKYFKKWYE